MCRRSPALAPQRVQLCAQAVLDPSGSGTCSVQRAQLRAQAVLDPSGVPKTAMPVGCSAFRSGCWTETAGETHKLRTGCLRTCRQCPHWRGFTPWSCKVAYGTRSIPAAWCAHGCSKELSREAAEQVFVCPLAAELWRRYGTELFWSGHALYELRHLLALVQRLYPSVRLALGPA